MIKAKQLKATIVKIEYERVDVPRSSIQPRCRALRHLDAYYGIGGYSILSISESKDDAVGLITALVYQSVIRSRSISGFGLSVRAVNRLKESGYETLGDILVIDNPWEIKRIPNIGKKTFNEILGLIKKYQ